MKNARPIAARRHAGFTILEIVIVFILLAGIMAFIGPKIFEMMVKGEAQIGKVELLNLAQRVDIYRSEVGRYPAALGDLVRQPAGADGKAGGEGENRDISN